MPFSVRFLFFIFLFFLLCFIDPSISDPRATQAALVCTNRTAPAPDRVTFVANFLSSMDSLTPLIASQRFARVVNGTGNNTVYAFGECMKDLSQNDCNLCFAQCKTLILRCLPFQRGVKGGRNYVDGCYLRYDDYDFIDEALSPGDTTVCGQAGFSNNSKGFRENAIELVRNLSLQAPDKDGFSVGSVDRWGTPVYGLAQCWEGLTRSGCVRCLANASLAVRSCLPKSEGRALNAGCYLRYSPQRFYYNSTGDGAGGRRGRRHLVVILAVVSSVVAVLMSIAACVFFGRRKLAKRREERKRFGVLLATVRKSDRNFKYETLEKATNYFHNSNKLGQGGSGSVYKGILPDGRPVAVKRLFFTTRQWVDQFFNEVNLISEVHHKNLVKLLGCSITGPESLLVYEYMPNRSLQDHLSDKNSNLLSWEVRFNIILGTAEGLAYLHEEAKLRIIHRDIKLSNILLDENFLPKIADFGLVRLFPEDKSHISTVIAGTLGYMAPEYVISGKLTEKADVYSFGVLLIEVICGKRNNSFTQDSISMLQMVWNHYTSSRLLDLVDPALEGSFQEDKASQVLQVGLLCTQASAELRPCMSTVVKILTGNSEIPQPTQPPFLNSYNKRHSPILAGINDTQPESHTQSSGNSITQSVIEPR